MNIHRILLPLFLLPFLATACITGDAPTERERTGTKSDTVLPGSCVDACGTFSMDGDCWCDADCVENGDCCADIQEVCEEPAPECDLVTCSLFCENGFETDEDGCEVCS